MADVNRFSERLIDAAERFADVVDSAQGRGARKNGSGGAKWLLLPVAGAAAYAVVTGSSSVARQTRQLLVRAKDRATDLPDADLLGRVQEATGREQQSRSRSSGTGTQNNRRRQTSQAQRRRRTTTR